MGQTDDCLGCDVACEAYNQNCTCTNPGSGCVTTRNCSYTDAAYCFVADAWWPDGSGGSWRSTQHCPIFWGAQPRCIRPQYCLDTRTWLIDTPVIGPPLITDNISIYEDTLTRVCTDSHFNNCSVTLCPCCERSTVGCSCQPLPDGSIPLVRILAIDPKERGCETTTCSGTTVTSQAAVMTTCGFTVIGCPIPNCNDDPDDPDYDPCCGSSDPCCGVDPVQYPCCGSATDPCCVNPELPECQLSPTPSEPPPPPPPPPPPTPPPPPPPPPP
ncbi:MAG TPA: hypothetical protein PJ989_12670, partial [Oligoflexia bacterium]|nr:hypothetical protein [Oligoflexia bacterium]